MRRSMGWKTSADGPRPGRRQGPHWRPPRPKRRSRRKAQRDALIAEELEDELQSREGALATLRAEAAARAAERDARALRPAFPDRLRFWLMTSTECYELQRAGAGWSVTKYSDGTVYTLRRDPVGRLACSCPGCSAYGPQCAAGGAANTRGC